MGNCKRKESLYKKNPWLAEYQEAFSLLFLKEFHISKMYDLFHRVDKDSSGTVETLELFMALDVERTPFTKRVFSIFDEDNSGQIDFKEFVYSVWNYCSLGKSTLAVFAFDLYDKDSSGQIDIGEVVQMLKDVYGNDYMKNTHAKNIYSELERLACDDIDINEFLEFARTHPGLLFPAFNMQEIIRNRVLGAAFWEHHSQKRIQISKGKYTTIGNFMELHLKETNIQYNETIKKIIAATGSLSKRIKENEENVPPVSKTQVKEPKSNNEPMVFHDELDQAVKKKEHKSKRRSSISSMSLAAASSTKAPTEGLKRHASVASKQIILSKIHPGDKPDNSIAPIDDLQSSSQTESKDTNLAL